MKILHITTELIGGAGLGALRLHHDLVSHGIDSSVLFLSGESDDPRIASLLHPGQPRKRRWRDIPSAVLHRIHAYDSPFYRANRSIAPFGRLSGAYVSSPFTRIDILRHPLVQTADIVHLHWVARFLDWPSFFQRIRKPVVWTMRDENPALGFWHFRSDMPSPMPESIRREDNWLRCTKERIVQKCQFLSIVSLSSSEDAFFSQSHAFRGRPHCVIPNSIDASIFRPAINNPLRQEFGIGNSDVVLLFVAQHIDEKRKGLMDFFQAVSHLGRKDIVILCVGRGEPPPIPEGVRFVLVGRVEDPVRLASLFSVANLFVTPSYAETFGKTTTEALACGIPVVSYPNSGAKDIIGPEDGILSSDFSPEALEEAIRSALSTFFDSAAIRERVVSRFSQKKVVQSYLELYRNAIG